MNMGDNKVFVPETNGKSGGLIAQSLDKKDLLSPDYQLSGPKK